jgi:hypothetical protein
MWRADRATAEHDLGARVRHALPAHLEIFDPDGPTFLYDDPGDENPRLDRQVRPIERWPQGADTMAETLIHSGLRCGEKIERSSDRGRRAAKRVASAPIPTIAPEEIESRL